MSKNNINFNLSIFRWLEIDVMKYHLPALKKRFVLWSMLEHSQLKQRGEPMLSDLKEVHLEKCPTKTKFGDGIKSLRKKAPDYLWITAFECRKSQ